MRVLLLEDNLDDTEKYRRKCLQFPDWKLRTFQDISDALAAHKEEPFDLYIVDSILVLHYDQPKPFEMADGSDFIIELRSLSPKLHAPVVIITQNANVSDVDGLWERNGKEYLISKNRMIHDKAFHQAMLEIIADQRTREA